MTNEDIVEIASLIYRRWSNAAETLDHVKNEKDDDSPDWDLFHEVRFETARADEWHWVGIRDRFNDEHRAVINQAYGI